MPGQVRHAKECLGLNSPERISCFEAAPAFQEARVASPISFWYSGVGSAEAASSLRVVVRLGPLAHQPKFNYDTTDDEMVQT
jgi:hypothetical protein